MHFSEIKKRQHVEKGKIKLLWKYLLVSIVMLCVMCGCGFFMMHHASGVKRADTLMNHYRWLITIFRCALMLIIIYFYPRWVKRSVLHISGVNFKQVAAFSRRRWIIGFFILYELVVVHNFLALPVNFLVSGSWH